MPRTSFDFISPGTRDARLTVGKLSSSSRARRAGSLEGRCRRARVDRPAIADAFSCRTKCREHSPTMRAGRLRAGAGAKTAGVPPGPQTAQVASRRLTSRPGRPRRARLVVAPAARRVVEGDHRVEACRNHPADAEKKRDDPAENPVLGDPSAGRAEFVAHMEQVLDLYQKPYDPDCPVVCMDEQRSWSRKPDPPMAATNSEPPRRVDRVLERAGTAAVFLFSEPLAGWRQATDPGPRTKVDWALEVAGLLDGRYATARRSPSVCDTQGTGAFYQVFEPARARELVRRSSTPARTGSALSSA